MQKAKLKIKKEKLPARSPALCSLPSALGHISRSGFSLLELLIVLLLLGVGSLIVLPVIDRSLTQNEVRQTALRLAATARNLRGRALYEGSPQRLILDPGENSYEAQGGKKIYLSTHVRFADITGGEPGERQERKFIFFPNGSVLGGEVAIKGETTATTYSVRLETLSGRVVVEEG